MKTNTSGKIIQLNQKRTARAVSGTEQLPRGTSGARVMAVTSGKGGVGKTNIVAGLGFVFSRMGQRVLVLDADLGLGNLDVLLGIAPRYNLSHVLRGEQPIEAVVVDGPGMVKILPAASGIQDITRLDGRQRSHLIEELGRLSGQFDLILIDTAAGISANVMYFNVSAHDILVVVTPEPTAITDAYALMKVLSVKYAERDFKLLVNMAPSEAEAREVHRQLNLVADRFLDIRLDYMGCVPHDRHVHRSVLRQKVVADLFPEAAVSRALARLGRTLWQSPRPGRNDGTGKGAWKYIVQEKINSLDR